MREGDKYTPEILKRQFNIHKEYVRTRKEASLILDGQIRLPCIPEDISENIIKFILHKVGDSTVTWNCSGDLHSNIDGKLECKCFTSDGPSSFTPSSEWNVIYFLDAQKWLDDYFVLYRVNLNKNSTEWKNVQINKTQKFEDQSSVGRRPRIAWKNLFPQIEPHCQKIFEGTFNDIFISNNSLSDQQSI